jgi:hypothetical protein
LDHSKSTIYRTIEDDDNDLPLNKNPDNFMNNESPSDPFKKGRRAEKGLQSFEKD